MKAAVVTAAGKAPVYDDFAIPVAEAGEELISVRASALSQFSKSRASGSHYSSDGGFPCSRRVRRCRCNAGWEASLFRLAGGALRGSRRVLSRELRSVRETPGRSR